MPKIESDTLSTDESDNTDVPRYDNVPIKMVDDNPARVSGILHGLTFALSQHPVFGTFVKTRSIICCRELRMLRNAYKNWDVHLYKKNGELLRLLRPGGSHHRGGASIGLYSLSPSYSLLCNAFKRRIPVRSGVHAFATHATTLGARHLL